MFHFLFLGIFINSISHIARMPKEESPEHHKKKHGKDVQELWDDIVKREKEQAREEEEQTYADLDEELEKEEE